MQPYVDSTDRGPTDFLLFALAFIGFLLGGAGVELNSAALALFGGVVMFFSVFALGCRSGGET